MSYGTVSVKQTLVASDEILVNMMQNGAVYWNWLTCCRVLLQTR